GDGHEDARRRDARCGSRDAPRSRCRRGADRRARESRRPRLRRADRGAAVIPAAWPREESLAERLLLIRGDRWEDRVVGDLPALLGKGDLLIVNDAATLPASLQASIARLGSAAP